MKPYCQAFAHTEPRYLIVAHRGAWHSAPENSLRAIEAAADAGFHIAEVDIQQSADGELFLLHDATLDRMTNGRGRASELSFQHLQDLRLRARDGGDNSPLTDYKIPSLAACLETARGRIYLDLDVKYPELLSPVAAQVKRMGLQDQVNIKGKLRDAEDLQNLQNLAETYGLLVMPQVRFERGSVDTLMGLVLKLRAPVVETKFDSLETLDRVGGLFQKAGLSVWVNTLDPVACCDLNDSLALTEPDASWGRLMKSGVSVIQTDEPEALSHYLTTKVVPLSA